MPGMALAVREILLARKSRHALRIAYLGVRFGCIKPECVLSGGRTMRKVSLVLLCQQIIRSEAIPGSIE